MAGSFFARDTLKVLHFGGHHWRADEAQLLDARRVGARMVVLDEQLNVLHALELDEAQRHNEAVVERLFVVEPAKVYFIKDQTFLAHGLCVNHIQQVLSGRVRCGHVKINGARLVDEQFHLLRSIALGRLELERMNLNHLVEGDGQYQLFVAVGLEELGRARQTVDHRIVVRLIETFAFVFRHEYVQIHLGKMQIPHAIRDTVELTSIV